MRKIEDENFETPDFVYTPLLLEASFSFMSEEVDFPLLTEYIVASAEIAALKGTIEPSTNIILLQLIASRSSPNSYLRVNYKM